MRHLYAFGDLYLNCMKYRQEEIVIVFVVESWTLDVDLHDNQVQGSSRVQRPRQHVHYGVPGTDSECSHSDLEIDAKTPRTPKGRKHWWEMARSKKAYRFKLWAIR